MFRSRTQIASLLTITLFAIGCNTDEETAQPTVEAIQAAPALITPVSHPEPPTVVKEQVQPIKEATQQEIELETKFTEQIDFFSSPKRPTAPSSLATPEQESEAVGLLGFIGLKTNDADSRLVLLRIGDHLARLGVGQTQWNVEVLAIQDRSVSLRRDRKEWTLSLFEKHDGQDSTRANRPQAEASSNVAPTATQG